METTSPSNRAASNMETNININPDSIQSRNRHGKNGNHHDNGNHQTNKYQEQQEKEKNQDPNHGHITIHSNLSKEKDLDYSNHDDAVDIIDDANSSHLSTSSEPKSTSSSSSFSLSQDNNSISDNYDNDGNHECGESTKLPTFSSDRGRGIGIDTPRRHGRSNRPMKQNTSDTSLDMNMYHDDDIMPIMNTNSNGSHGQYHGSNDNHNHEYYDHGDDNPDGCYYNDNDSYISSHFGDYDNEDDNNNDNNNNDDSSYVQRRREEIRAELLGDCQANVDLDLHNENHNEIMDNDVPPIIVSASFDEYEQQRRLAIREELRNQASFRNIPKIVCNNVDRERDERETRDFLDNVISNVSAIESDVKRMQDVVV